MPISLAVGRSPLGQTFALRPLNKRRLFTAEADQALTTQECHLQSFARERRKVCGTAYAKRKRCRGGWGQRGLGLRAGGVSLQRLDDRRTVRSIASITV